MKVFLAGATRVLGMRLVPLLVATGHDVTGMTRSPAKAERLAELGATRAADVHRVDVDRAAARTIDHLLASTGTYTIVD